MLLLRALGIFQRPAKIVEFRGNNGFFALVVKDDRAAFRGFGLLRNLFWLLLDFLNVFMFLLLFDVCFFDLLLSVLFIS